MRNVIVVLSLLLFASACKSSNTCKTDHCEGPLFSKNTFELDYKKVPIDTWNVYVTPELLKHKEWHAMKKELTSQLYRLDKVLPEKTLKFMKTVKKYKT